MANSRLARLSQYPTIPAAAASTDNLRALATQALASHLAGRYLEAVGQYDRIILLKPDLSDIHNNRGLALAALGRFDAAIAAYRRALELKPEDAQVLCNWAAALVEDYRTDEAEQKVRSAIALNPGLAEAHNNLALILKEKGRISAAKAAAKQAIHLAPRKASYYEHLGAIRSFTAGDRYFTTLEALGRDCAALGVTDRIHLHFALGKAYEDTSNFDAAFRQWLAGTALKRRQLGYDESITLARMDRARELFTANLTNGQNAGVPSSLPIFIVGMPRSGSTLIEQILASHPAIFGGGELNLFEQCIDAVRQALPGTPPFPDLISALSGAQFSALGSLYADKLKQRAPRAARITDKMPANFLFAGLIHLALPNAAIIHAVRDPLDTCVSCFATHFTRGQSHTYDLAELGRYYRHYRSLMAHWHRVLPPGRILDVHYEELVGDVAAVARRIVEHCGLTWDPRCLDFHRSERTVRTASAAQVRKPIYGSSVERWRRYEKFLWPLLAELEKQE